MSKYLKLFDNHLNWLSTLLANIADEGLINLIVNLDQIYQGLESYLDLSEMPGSLITNILIESKNSHFKFQNKIVNDAFEDMPFFKIGALARVNEGNCIWNPRVESLKGFILKHTGKEVIYFEDENYKEIVRFFQKQFSSHLLS